MTLQRKTPMKRGSWGTAHVATPEYRAEQRALNREANMRLLLATRGRKVTMGGRTTPAMERTQPRRNAQLLRLARGQRCLLAVPGVCNHDCRTTVACHSNWQEHGKSYGRKADDHYSVWGCTACHRWLDQGMAPMAEKRNAWDMAHINQCFWWALIAVDHSYKAKERAAAQWALDRIQEDRLAMQEKRA